MKRRNTLFVDASMSLLLTLGPAFALAAEKAAGDETKVEQGLGYWEKLDPNVDYQARLPRIKPCEPEEALQSFQLAPDLRIELVAAEPLVCDVVDMAFDEHPRVREHAVRLAEQVLADAPAIREKLYHLSGDDDLRVRYQAAFTLGEIPGAQATAVRWACGNWTSRPGRRKTPVLTSATERLPAKTFARAKPDTHPPARAAILMGTDESALRTTAVWRWIIPRVSRCSVGSRRRPPTAGSCLASREPIACT